MKYRSVKRRIIITVLASIIVISSLTPITARAIDGKYDQTFYSNNDILIYNPTDVGCGTDTATYTGPTDVATLVPTAQLQAIFTQLLANTVNPINATQAAAIMGNMYGESGLSPTADESKSTPPGPGYGLAQWSSAGRKAALAAFAKAAGKDISDPTVQVGFLLQEYNTTYAAKLKGSDFDNATDISKATTAWMDIYESPLVQTGADPSALNSKRIPAAIKIFGFYSSLDTKTAAASDASTNTDTNCGASGGVVEGKIAETAEGLALTSPEKDGSFSETNAMTAATGYTIARNTYQALKPKINPGVAWTDCGGFVATVMISSGVDPSYVKVGVLQQIAYVKAHPDKYKIINKPKASDLQPGDILLSSSAGHTQMYTGAPTYPVAQASLGGEVPNQRWQSSAEWMLSQSSIILARFIGNAS
jgi:hypothetical protein